MEERINLTQEQKPFFTNEVLIALILAVLLVYYLFYYKDGFANLIPQSLTASVHEARMKLMRPKY